MIRHLLMGLVLSSVTGLGARAGTIIDDWGSVQVPPPPSLKAVKLDPNTTALLMLDFNGREDAASGPCNASTKPRCLASVASVRVLLDAARQHGVLVVYSLSGNGKPDDIRPELAPRSGEPIVKSGPDKFLGTDLAQVLTGKNIKTVVVAGTASEGAVLMTGAEAALHGLSVVVPVDAMSSTDPYAEQYVAWHFTHAPAVSSRATLTRIDMIGF